MKTLADARDAYWRHTSSGASPEEKIAVFEQYIKELERNNHQLACELATHQITHWPRIRDLPESERVEFHQWLSGQTCPLLTGVSFEDQDAFYPWDYERWQQSVAGKKVLWD